MKKHIYKLLLVCGAVTFWGCEGQDTPLDLDEITATNGGILRITEVTSGSYDLFDIDNSFWQIEIEADDAQDGELLESVDLFLDFVDNTPVNNTIETDQVFLFNVPASAFVVNSESGLPRTTLRVDATDALAALGLSAGEIDGGDQFRFDWTLNLSNGQSFNVDNTGGNIQGGAFFNSPFTARATVVCLIPETSFVGTYTYNPGNTGAFGVAPFGDNPYEVEVIATSATTRQVELFYLAQFVPGFTFELVFDVVCSSIIPINDQVTGVGCGGSIVVGAPAPEDFGVIDPDNEDVINVTVLDFQEDGGCGVPPENISFTLTR